MKLSTPCNGFETAYQRHVEIQCNFQLHVMDSKDRVVLKVNETTLLSTPCNGFSKCSPIGGSRSVFFQLHVMDSEQHQLVDMPRFYFFQLHVMDSALWGALS